MMFLNNFIFILVHERDSGKRFFSLLAEFTKFFYLKSPLTFKKMYIAMQSKKVSRAFEEESTS